MSEGIHKVRSVRYSAHTKQKKAGPSTTLKVTYAVEGNQLFTEYISVEGTGNSFARKRAAEWLEDHAKSYLNFSNCSRSWSCSNGKDPEVSYRYAAQFEEVGYDLFRAPVAISVGKDGQYWRVLGCLWEYEGEVAGDDPKRPPKPQGATPDEMDENGNPRAPRIPPAGYVGSPVVQPNSIDQRPTSVSPSDDYPF